MDTFDLKPGQVAVLRTDTLYGLVAKIDDQAAVEKVYHLKGRDFTKPCIVLVSDKKSIGQYGKLVTEISGQYERATTVVVPKTTEPEWITRGGDTVAYRIPKDQNLQELLKEKGPLIAPSANPQGLAPARNITEARNYFGDEVDIYVDDGEVPENIQASRVIRIMPDGSIKELRN